MPTVDPKPRNRPFRRVLYREDSKDSTVVQDVSPRSDGHLVENVKKQYRHRLLEDGHIIVMTNASRKLLMKEGILYKSPVEQIKYVKRIPNDPMARYLFQMKRFNHSSLGSFNSRDTHNQRSVLHNSNSMNFSACQRDLQRKNKIFWKKSQCSM